MKRKNAWDEVPKLSKKERVIVSEAKQSEKTPALQGQSPRPSRFKVFGRWSFVIGLAFLFSGCAGMTPDNFTFDTSNHQTNPQPLLGVDIQFDPQINVTNTNDNSSSADSASNPTVTSTTSDTTTNTSTGGASTNTNTASTVK